MTRLPRLRRAGDAALSLELGDGIDAATNARVRALDLALARDPFPGFLESVPAYRSLLVLFDPARAGAAAAGEALLRLAARADAPAAPGRLHRIPTLYGGEAGPDLADLARRRGIAPQEVVALHASREYTAFMLGFTPGFAYLGLLPEALDTPRRATPRVRVPAGSVAVAGLQTAVYPVASPGGWNLIGRTSLRLFDPALDPPALLAPGDRVVFAPVAELPEAEPAWAAPVPGEGALEVEEGGLLTTVQDLGRKGLRRLGVGGAGAMDPGALVLANLAVGNEPGAAGLECTIAGPALRFLKATRFAVAGADLGAVLERDDLGEWRVPPGTAALARPGNRLVFSGRLSGCRAYVAFAGGIDVPRLLGSRSTDLSGGFGGLAGRALSAGDRLPLGRATGDERPRPPSASPAPVAAAAVTLRVVLGPQDDHFGAEALRAFLSETWTVGATSDRVGCRLLGPVLLHEGGGEIVTDGMLPGSVQVPPDGQPIVMGADAPTTGGYPKIATVVTADLPLLAQVVPGEGRLRFAPA